MENLIFCAVAIILRVSIQFLYIYIITFCVNIPFLWKNVQVSSFEVVPSPFPLILNEHPFLNLLQFLVNPLMHNVPKWSDTVKRFCSKCCKIFKVCLAILGHYALKG